MAFNDEPMNMDVDFNLGDLQPPAPSDSVPHTPRKRKVSSLDSPHAVLLNLTFSRLTLIKRTMSCFLQCTLSRE